MKLVDLDAVEGKIDHHIKHHNGEDGGLKCVDALEKLKASLESLPVHNPEASGEFREWLKLRIKTIHPSDMGYTYRKGVWEAVLEKYDFAIKPSETFREWMCDHLKLHKRLSQENPKNIAQMTLKGIFEIMIEKYDSTRTDKGGSLAELADRKGWWITWIRNVFEKHKELESPYWQIVIEKDHDGDECRHFYGHKYSEAESKAREYLSRLPDAK